MGDIIIPSEEKGWFVMKALSVSRLVLVIGLALVLMVVWTAATPKVVSAHALIGGELENADGCNCTGTTSGINCNDHYTDCFSSITTCDVGGSGPATCSLADNYGTCTGDPACTQFGDSQCN